MLLNYGDNINRDGDNSTMLLNKAGLGAYPLMTLWEHIYMSYIYTWEEVFME